MKPLCAAKRLLGVGDTHEVLFLQGGASQLFNTIPMNFANGKSADYLVSGEWSKKAASAAKEVGTTANIVASSESSNFDHHPEASSWKLNPGRRVFPHLLE